MAHLFVSNVFQDFGVVFWLLLKCYPEADFGGKKSFLQHFIFYPPYESITFIQQDSLHFMKKWSIVTALIYVAINYY